VNEEPAPDIDIAAGATARELRFRGRPEVQLHGDQTASARTRLPRPVRPGVTYHRAEVAIRIAARLTGR
jgi:hypothetical protein